MDLKAKIGAAGVMILMLITACSGEKAEEQVKTRVEALAGFVKTNATDSIKGLYPQVTAEDSLVSFDAKDIVVEPVDDNKTIFNVKCGENIEMKVRRDENGRITVESSKGLFAYSPQRMAIAKKFGQWKEGATDVENSKRMNDSFFMQEFVPGIASEIKDNVKVSKLGGVSFDGPLGVKVTNNNDFKIDGSDYSVAYVQRSYMWMMGMYEKGDISGTFPGATLTPNASKSYSVENPQAMNGNEVHSANIKWKISDQEIVNKYYKPTGKEYEQYLSSVKGSATDGKLGDGPFHISGKLGGKYAIHMTMDKGVKTGSYYYDKNGAGSKLTLRVLAFNSATGQIKMEETDNNGKVTATFIGQLTQKAFKGKMTVSNGKTYQFDLVVEK